MGDVVRKLSEELGITKPTRLWHVVVHVWAQPGDYEGKVAGEVAEGLRRAGRDARVQSVDPATPGPPRKKGRIVTDRNS